MLDVRRLRLLRELAYRGTIAAVAEALTFTPSAVSQQLAALEREAGVALLERTGRRVALTPAGVTLVRHAEAVLERLEQAAAELAAAKGDLSGTVRIGAFPTATRAILPSALAALARSHPGLDPMVDEVDPAEVAPRLRAGELDVALVHEYDFVPAEPDLALDAVPLLDEPMYLATVRPAAWGGGRGHAPHLPRRAVDRLDAGHPLPHDDRARLPGGRLLPTRTPPHRRLRHGPGDGRRRAGRGARAGAGRRRPARRRHADRAVDAPPHPRGLPPGRRMAIPPSSR